MRKYITLFFCLILTACNLPTVDADNDVSIQAGTIVAMTMRAQEVTATEQKPLASPTLGATETPTPTITPTYSVPMLNVDESTNCRTGPGQTYNLITTFNAGESVEIVGRYPVNNYWVVKIPGGDDTCWIWGDYSTATGSHWTVPSVTPPATAKPGPVAKPGSLSYNYFCSFNGTNSDISVTLNWKDKSGDELGFRVFRDNANIADLPPNSTTYSETITGNATQVFSYSVSSYNNSGESARSTISFSCK